MPTQLTDADQTMKDRVVQPLVSAHMNGHFGTKVLDYTTALFGAQTTEQALKDYKADLDEIGPSQMNGGFGQTVTCTSLCRAWWYLEQKGQTANANELRGIACDHFGEKTVADQCADVMLGRR
jgi:hypothetical protein